jgi:hypothetical protein
VWLWDLSVCLGWAANPGSGGAWRELYELGDDSPGGADPGGEGARGVDGASGAGAAPSGSGQSFSALLGHAPCGGDGWARGLRQACAPRCLGAVGPVLGYPRMWALPGDPTLLAGIDTRGDPPRVVLVHASAAWAS